jgi:hypothetical protein
MHPAIGDQDRPGNAGAGFLGQGFGQRGHDQASGILVTVTDAVDAKFGVRHLRDLGLNRGHRRLGLGAAVRQALACAVVDDKDHDVRQVLPFFFLQGRIGQCYQKRSQGERAKPPAGQTAPQGEADKKHRNDARRDKQRPRDQRREDHGCVHCPSLSRRAGTWTWSDL